MTEVARTARERTNLGGVVEAVHPGSPAHAAGLQAGDHVLAVDGHVLRDAVDFQYYAAEDSISLDVMRADDALRFTIEKHPDEHLGIDFRDAAFDGVRICNNSCFFCFLKGNPKGMRKTLYVKDDDYRLSFFHGNFVTLTNLDETDWQRLAEQRLSPINVSVHATEPELRRYLLGNKTAPDICEQLRRLGSIGIQANTQVVLCPGVNDGAALDRTVSDLAALYPAVQTISVVPVGATMTAEERIERGAHSDEIAGCTPEFARSVINQLRPYQRRFRREHSRTLVYLADEYYLTAGVAPPPAAHYDGFAQYENGIGMTRSLLRDWRTAQRACVRREGLAGEGASVADSLGARGLARRSGTGVVLREHRGSPGGRPRRVSFVCGTLIAPVMRDITREFASITGIGARVHPVENRFFGPRVNVSGLLTAQDIERVLLGQDLGDLALLPRYALDYTGTRFLDDATPLELQRALGVPLAFASTLREALQILDEPVESEVTGASAGATTNGKSWVDYSERGGVATAAR